MYGTPYTNPAAAPRGPRFTILPESVVVEGRVDFVYLECSAFSIPPSTYSWLESVFFTILFSLIRFLVRLFIQFFFVFVLLFIWILICFVSFFCFVFFLIFILQLLFLLILSLTCRAELPCRYRQTSSSLVMVTPQLDSRYNVVDGRLSIQNPQEEKDAGAYYCTAVNDFGTVRTHSVRISFGCK